jgi:protein-tyrosine phosphatase
VIDFHTHILPCIDDGSKSLKESVDMLRLLSEQGVGTVVLTPHYYARNETVSEFLIRRDRAYADLLEAISEEDHSPELRLGAEVAYFSGISNMPDLEKLQIQNTNYLLLEMPFEEWSSLTMREVQNILLKQRIVPIIAHVERYFAYQHVYEKIEELIDLGVLLQVNAEAFLGFFSRKKVLRMIKDNQINLIGSDCHNMGKRKPNIDLAKHMILKKLGTRVLKRIEVFSSEVLFNNSTVE